MKCQYLKVTYPLVFPFKLSYGTFYERSGVIVTLTEDGHTGYGEMSFVPYYRKKETDVLQQLDEIFDWLSSISQDWTPAGLYERISETFSVDPFVMSAVDCALYDLWGRLQERPVWQLINADQKVEAPSSLTITEDDWQEKLSWDWPILKLKMGFEGDMELLQEIRRNYDGPLRIDANSGWSITGLEKRVEQLQKWNVDLVEQPVAPKDDLSLKELKLPLPIAADESIQGLADVKRIPGIYQVVNIKLQKCGGITPALKIIRKCREMGLELMAGCMTESSVGIGAMAHLGSFFDYLDLDGEHLIQTSFSEEKFVEKGKVVLPEMPGIGGGLYIGL